jgi:hypothetical protein
MDDEEVDAKRPRPTPERFKELIDGLTGLMKDEIAAYGGTEGYMRWVRGSDEED